MWECDQILKKDIVLYTKIMNLISKVRILEYLGAGPNDAHYLSIMRQQLYQLTENRGNLQVIIGLKTLQSSPNGIPPVSLIHF